MSDPTNKAQQALDSLTEKLVDDVLNASDIELLAEAKEEGRDVAGDAARSRAIFAKALAVQGKRKMVAARAAVNARVVSSARPSGQLTPVPGAPTELFLNSVQQDIILAHVVMVTPEMAKAWLTTNTQNRSIRKRYIPNLVAAITEGEWKLTHQGIAFSKSGVMLDGQHRLMAIVEADMPAILPVFVNMPDDIFGALDKGTKRQVRDDIKDVDSRIIDACTFLQRVNMTSERSIPSAAEVKHVYDVFGEDFEIMRSIASSSVKGRVMAPTRAAWALRHHVSNIMHQRILLCAQWKAFVDFEIKSMDETTVACITRLEHLKSNSGASATERMIIAWKGFDPLHRKMSKILIRADTEIKEIRELLAELL